MEAVVFPEACRVRFAHKQDSLAERATWGFAEEVSHEMSRNTPERRRVSQRLQARAEAVVRQTPAGLDDGRILLPDVTALAREGGRKGLDLAGVRARRVPGYHVVGGV